MPRLVSKQRHQKLFGLIGLTGVFEFFGLVVSFGDRGHGWYLKDGLQKRKDILFHPRRPMKSWPPDGISAEL
jgi:hypothetical protein